MRTVDADQMRVNAIKECPECILNGSSHCKGACPVNEVTKAIDEAPTVETFTRKELESWLYQIAMNNLDGVERDKVFSDDCIELINRLDGFERYTNDKREGKI